MFDRVLNMLLYGVEKKRNCITILDKFIFTDPIEIDLEQTNWSE